MACTWGCLWPYLAATPQLEMKHLLCYTWGTLPACRRGEIRWWGGQPHNCNITQSTSAASVGPHLGTITSQGMQQILY